MPAKGEIVGESLPPGVEGEVQGQLCVEVLHAPENLRFRWWGMRDFSTLIPSKKPPSSPYLSHAIRTTPDCFACYVRDGDPALAIERESGPGVSTPINLRPFLRGMDLVLDASLPLSGGHEVHLRITTFWNTRDLVNSFEKNEQLARDMVNESIERRVASTQQTIEPTRTNGSVAEGSSTGLASLLHTGVLSDALTTKVPPRTRSPLLTTEGNSAPASATFSSTMPGPRPDILDSLHNRARRLQMKTPEIMEPVVQAQLEDLLASDPMYSVKNTPAVSSNARVSPSHTRTVVEHHVSKPGAAMMTVFVDWISLRRGMPQQASSLQLLVEYDGRGTNGARRQVAQFCGKQLVPPDRVVIQDAQTIALEGIPPEIMLRLEGKNIAAEGKLAWTTVSRSQQFLIHLQSIAATPSSGTAPATASAKKTTPKAVSRPPPYGMVSLVCSVEQHHLLVVLHRLDLKKPARAQINFKIGPNEEVTTPGFRDELNFATVSQDPVTLDAIIFEVWAFPRADLIGLCKVPVPSAETTVRSELFSWHTGEVIGALDLTLRRAPKAQLQPFLTPKAKPHDGNNQQEDDSSLAVGVSEWLQVGCASLGRVLVNAKLGELKTSLSCEELLQTLLDHCQGLTRNEALVLACTILRHFRGDLRGIAPAHKSWTEPLDEASVPGSFVLFWVDSRQRLALETIKRLVPQPTPGLIRVLREKWSFDLGEPTRWSREAFVSFLQTHGEGAPSWDLVEGMFKALDEFGSNEIDAWVFASLVLRHEENVVRMHLAAQSDLLEFLQEIAADDKVTSVKDFFFGFVVHDHFVHKSAFAHVAQRLISEQQATRLAEFLATPEGVDLRTLETLLSKKDEQTHSANTDTQLPMTYTSVAKECVAGSAKSNVPATLKEDENEENASNGRMDGRLARLSSEWERASRDGNIEFLPSQARTFHLRSSIDRDADSLVRCGPSSLPAHPGAKALCLDFLAKLVCGEIPIEIAHAVLNDAAQLLHRGSHVAVAAWQTLSFSASPEAARTALRAFSERDPLDSDLFIVTEERLREAIDAFPLLDAELDDTELHKVLRDLEDEDGFIHAQDLSTALECLNVPFPSDYSTKLRYSNIKQQIRRRGSSPGRHDISVEYPLHDATSDRWRIPRSRCFDFPPYITFALLTYTPAASSSGGGGASDTLRGKLFYEFLTYILGLDKTEAGAILKSMGVTKTSSQVSYKDWRRYFEEVDCKRQQKLQPQQSLSLATLRQQIRQMLDFADISVAPFLDEALDSQGVTRESAVSWEVLKRVLAHLRLPNLESKDIVEWCEIISRFRELPTTTFGDMVAWLSRARSFLARHLDDFFGALLMAPDGPVDLDVMFPTSTNASAEDFLSEIKRVCRWDTDSLPRRYEEALEVLESDGLRGVFLPEVKQMYRNFRQRNGTVLRTLQKCMKESGESTTSLFRKA